mmetsp:Transcript_12151/g.28888  ORF Transcript_12151/g.28888 Transcript_12151/m.28888 type:complete len:359 (-) Transcript_12151:390-1466(-)
MVPDNRRTSVSRCSHRAAAPARLAESAGAVGREDRRSWSSARVASCSRRSSSICLTKSTGWSPRYACNSAVASFARSNASRLCSQASLTSCASTVALCIAVSASTREAESWDSRPAQRSSSCFSRTSNSWLRRSDSASRCSACVAAFSRASQRPSAFLCFRSAAACASRSRSSACARLARCSANSCSFSEAHAARASRSSSLSAPRARWASCTAWCDAAIASTCWDMSSSFSAAWHCCWWCNLLSCCWTSRSFCCWQAYKRSCNRDESSTCRRNRSINCLFSSSHVNLAALTSSSTCSHVSSAGLGDGRQRLRQDSSNIRFDAACFQPTTTVWLRFVACRRRLMSPSNLRWASESRCR